MTREEVAALLDGGRLYSAGRDRLYTADELMAGYRSDAPMQSLDARLAAHVKASGIPPTDVDEAIAQVVHDQGVDQAMRAYVAASVAYGRHIAGVMGGATTPRDAPAYRLAAQTAKALSGAGFLQGSFGTLQEIFQDLAQNGAAAPAQQAAMVFVDTAAYGQPGSPFHLARASRAAAPFDDLITLADSADEVVAAMRAGRRRRS